MNEIPIENRGEIIIYRAEDNTIQLDVRMENETVWLTASQMAELFGRDVKTIRKHINNALHEELAGEVVGAKYASTTKNEFLPCANFALPKKNANSFQNGNNW